SHGGIVLPPAPPSVYQVAITTSQAQGGVVLSVPVGADPFGSVRLSFADGSAWSPEEFRTLVYAGSDRSDMFYGTTGLAETFTFGLGRGRDTIRRFDPLQDTLALETDDVSFSTVSYRAYAGTDHYGNGQYNTVSSILVTLNASGEVLELYDQHLMGSEPFVRLPNGVVLTGAEMQVYRGPLRVLPTMADDRVAGSADDDVLLGLSGADVLTGLAGADTLDGGLGDDTLQGGSGHDLLRGGSGSNVFAYDRGDGRDTLVADVATTQTLVFGEGITASDIEISRAFVSGAYSPAVLGTQVLFKSRPADSVTSWFELSSIRFADGSTWGAQEFKDAMYRGSSAHDRIFGDAAGNVLQGGDGDDTLSGEAGADVLSGGAGRDSLRGGLDADALDGGSGDDTLSGDEGFDTLEGGEGGDWLDGGAGADRLKGGRGNDVIYTFTDYQYNDGAADVITFEAGDGQDTVGAGAEDTLVFGAGLSRDDLLIGTLPVGPGKEFVLGFRGRTDAVTVRVDTGGRGIPSLRFADGRTLSSADLTAIVTRDQPKDLMGTSGRDTLTGGGGNDTLTGLAGQDTLSGGKGNDLLVGGKGSDTYLFARGDGRDTIVEADSTWLVTDVLKVGDAKSNQLWLTRSGNSLDISIIGTTDKVTVQDWFVSSANRVEKITALGDNKTLSYTKVNALVTAMAAFAPPAQGQTILPTDVQASLNKVLASSWA
ncbi:MAG TPA: calcium-binding protein, partial [Aquabacterium sp.]|uniref:calcium-binding protein n=1 Tax=Aquabacterium sp. TaxID=1872578 RepID=UPI002E36DB10